MEKKTLVTWLVLMFWGYAPLLFGAPVQIKSVKFEGAARDARLIFDFSALPKYRISRGSKPNQLRIDLENVAFPEKLGQPPAFHPLGAKLTPVLDEGEGSSRILLDFKHPTAHKAYLTRFKGSVRLVLELTPPVSAAQPGNKTVSMAPAKPARPANTAVTPKAAGKLASAKPVSSPGEARPVRFLKPAPGKERVIVIDAGHGGKDTGAIGPNGTYEKDVVLAIARKLERLIRAEPGMRAVMVRKGDQFIDLRERAELARKAKADLFISLHADAYITKEVKGSSVFILSDHGASSEAARWLADRENAALVGGVQLKGKDKILASVLLDLSQTATIEASNRAAAKVLGQLKKSFHLHHRDVQKAGFMVLKSPDVPSILVETAFISNPDEEQNLRNPKHQDQIARAIFEGVRRYFAEIRPMVPIDLRVADAQETVAEPDAKTPAARK